MKNAILRYNSLILILGLVLIAIGFFIFYPHHNEYQLLILNLVVAGFVFGVNFSLQTRIIKFKTEQGESIGGLGVRFFGTILYSLIAIVVFVFSLILSLKFSHQLFFHLTAVFLFLVFSFYSSGSERKTLKVSSEQISQRKGKDEILFLLNRLEILSIQKSEIGIEWKEVLHSFREDAQVMAPTNNDEAIQLEKEIITLLQEVHQLTKNDSFNHTEVFDLLTQSVALLKLRKGIYSK